MPAPTMRASRSVFRLVFQTKTPLPFIYQIVTASHLFMYLPINIVNLSYFIVFFSNSELGGGRIWPEIRSGMIWEPPRNVFERQMRGIALRKTVHRFTPWSTKLNRFGGQMRGNAPRELAHRFLTPVGQAESTRPANSGVCARENPGDAGVFSGYFSSFSQNAVAKIGLRP